MLAFEGEVGLGDSRHGGFQPGAHCPYLASFLPGPSKVDLSSAQDWLPPIPSVWGAAGAGALGSLHGGLSVKQMMETRGWSSRPLPLFTRKTHS